MQLFSLHAPQQPKNDIKKMTHPKTMAAIGIPCGNSMKSTGIFIISALLVSTKDPNTIKRIPATKHRKLKRNRIYFTICAPQFILSSFAFSLSSHFD